MFENMTKSEWARLDGYLYTNWKLEGLSIGDVQVIRRDLLELSFKVQEWVNAHEDDDYAVSKAGELDLNILYLLRDLDWKLEGIIS